MNTPKTAKTPTDDLVQALAVTAEVTGTEMSKSAMRAIADDLAQYPYHQVMGALRRCRREVSGRLTLAAILQRLDDGRPTPELAWSQVCQLTERDTFVGTTEQIQAFAAVSAMIDAGDTIPARMAFLERYKALVATAKDNGEPTSYAVSPGFDAYQRDSVVRQAHEQGLLADEQAAPHVRGLLPDGQKLLEKLGGVPATRLSVS